MAKAGSVGIAFVDTLTCALGSLLLLWMALAATPPREPGVSGQGVLLTIEVRPDESQPNTPMPLLSVRLKSNGTYLEPLAANKTGQLHVSPGADGASLYSVVFMRQGLLGDELVVSICDLNGRAGNAPVWVTATVIGPNGRDSRSLKLELQRPVMSAVLDKVMDGTELVWK